MTEDEATRATAGIQCTSTPDDLKKGIFRCIVPVHRDVFARIVSGMYADGLTHAEVTAKLDAMSTAWREQFGEIHFEDGSRRWMLRPDGLTFTLKLENADGVLETLSR